jgi:hypothetical protein
MALIIVLKNSRAAAALKQCEVQPERKLCSENLEGSFWAKVFDGKIGKNF